MPANENCILKGITLITAPGYTRTKRAFHVCLLTIFLFSGFSVWSSSDTPSSTEDACITEIVEGVINLDCLGEDVVTLSGDWRFSWQRLPGLGSDGIGKPPALLQVPGLWRNAPFQDGDSPGKGVGTYSLKLEFSRPVIEGLAISPGKGTTKLQVYLRPPEGEDILIYENLDKEGNEIVPGDIVPIEPVVSGTELILKVTNLEYYSGSMGIAPRLGKLSNVITDQLRARVVVSILLGGYVLFGLYNLVLAAGYRGNRIFYLMALICFTCALRLVSTDTLLAVVVEDPSIWIVYEVGWITVFALGAFWSLYIYFRYPLILMLNISRILSGVSLTGIILVVLTSPEIYVKLGIAYRYLILGCIGIGIPVLLRDYFQGRLGSEELKETDRVTIYSIILVTLAVCTDLILYIDYRSLPIDLSTIAFFVLILGQTFVVAREYPRMLQREKDMAAQLKQANIDLEEEVRTRTNELLQVNEKLEEMVRTDQLTGLPNRKAFEEGLLREIDRFDRTGLPLTLFILDADHFKSINDNYGHDIGDIVLKHLADIISGEARVIDLPSRIGGEEFAVLLTQTNIDGARMLAERIRSEVEKAIIVTGDQEIRFTISGGIAAYEKDMKSQEFFRNADQALYQAKELGRNRILVWEATR